jgi:leader peptidase (prepilin peptidase) / N-methyltransferase
VNIILAVFFTGLGAIIGSFLNVVLYRFNTGRGIGGRSKCFSCNKTLGVMDLVPVLSFLANRFRCRHCGSRVSWQYISVEVLTAVLFLGVFIHYLPILHIFPAQFLIQVFFTCILMSLLVLIIVYDIRHKIIPDLFSYTFAVLTFIAIFIGFDSSGVIAVIMPDFLTLIAGLILAFPFYLLWLISDGRWMGLGDGKLALGIGWFLGLYDGISSVVLSFWIGAVFSLVLLAFNWFIKNFYKTYIVKMLVRCINTFSKKVFGIHYTVSGLDFRSEIPFAPFLIIGLLITFFFGYNVFEWNLY